ncbi:MAG TPA: alkaline phosphatase D family protein [Solirubrobacteraceae bacterium]|nr:alkaline phosphatase D family protein [Solirubrobacteraceae bacterium]
MAITGDWDRRISRRTLLKTGGSFAAGITLIGLTSDRALAQPSFDSDPFTLGVASGDPTPQGVVLWTRLAPSPLVVGGGLPAEPYEVRYELARDEDFRHIHRHGSTAALPDEAHSVRVELDDLPPERAWYYRFKAGDAISPVGRTRTTPPGNSQLGTLKLAFVSCQNYAEGYFTPYADVAQSDLDAVIFLGDYIYEGGAHVVRAHAPAREIRTLDEYRIRHGQYKTDADLQAAHAAHPWLVTWDDHEFKNNHAGFDIDPDVPIEVARERRAAAYRAYWEHMPLARARKPEGPDLQLYRRFHWGKLVTFNVLDGRQYRSDQPPECTNPQRDGSGYCPDNLLVERTMLGSEQLEWLLADLATTKTRWNVLAQQTAFAPFNRPAGALTQRFIGTDNWDGYVAERQRILDWLAERGTLNPLVLTGDAHRNRVSNVPPDYRTLEGDPVAVEFLGTSVSSNGDEAVTTRYCDDPANPHVVFQNNNRGYVRCTVTPDAWTSECRAVTTVTAPAAEAWTLATATVENGRPGVLCAGGV